MAQDKISRQPRLEWLRHIALVNISILILPVSILAIFYCYAAQILCPQDGLRRKIQRSARFRPKNVMITGISTPAGLRAARALYATGHNIVGVEAGKLASLSHARWSRVVAKFYALSTPSTHGRNSKYAEDILRIVVRERVSLWIDCSDGRGILAQAQARGVVEQRSSCVCLVPTLDQTQQLETRQGFRQLAKKLGLPSPAAHSVQSRNDIFNVLNISDGRQYLLSSPNGTTDPPTRLTLPRRTVSQTYQDLAQLKLKKGSSWTLEQYTAELLQFTACGVVVQGQVRAFAASSISARGDCKVVSATSGLANAMKQYMESFAKALGDDLSSHVTMEYCLDERATQAGVVQQILPLSGRLIPHENLLLFEGQKGAINLTQAYMSLLSATTTELEVYTGLPYRNSTTETVVPSDPDIGVYFLFKDLRGLIVDPLLQMMTLRTNILKVARSWIAFLQHLVAWQEALYAFGDPLPLFWYTHVFAPCNLVSDLMQRIWSRARATYYRRSSRDIHEREPARNGT